MVLAFTLLTFQKPLFAKRMIARTDVSTVFFDPLLEKYSLEVDEQEVIPMATAREILTRLKKEIRDSKLINGVLAHEEELVLGGTNEVIRFSKEKRKLSKYGLFASFFCGLFFDFGVMNTPLIVIPVANLILQNEIQKQVERRTKAHKEQQIFGMTVEAAKQDIKALSDEFYVEKTSTTP